MLEFHISEVHTLGRVGNITRKGTVDIHSVTTCVILVYLLRNSTEFHDM